MLSAIDHAQRSTRMTRRRFLTTATKLSGLAAVAGMPGFTARARADEKVFAPRPGTWHTYEMTTRVEILFPEGVTRVWLPAPALNSEYQQVIDNRWSGNPATAKLVTDPKYAAGILYAEFPKDQKDPQVELVSRFKTQDRAIDWSHKTPGREDAAALAFWTQPTELMPTDGIVRDTARDITKGAASDIDKTRAVYDWIVANAYREPKVRGCGTGDVRTMLETKNFGGKCADINALFVALLRSSGVPSRDVYGIRVAPSAFGYKALGASSPNVTRAQHCRAEVYLRDHGWVAMDPADVAKVAREETSEWLKIDHPTVKPVRARLFGSWEGNWIGYNMAHDVALPNGTVKSKLGFLMYPQAETEAGRADSLDPDNFKYTITAREIPA
jgi:transglutaminase-like putative cysteine protease